ncbi:hypothetical protein KIL84_000417 [Mauremys mutica]|uniref:Uncharacterized protein n=1 Tax=Mauremys mutica TaxID=74926 RepID=A0A9D4B3I7_9SAUR|nr:hypothetical protein KIL84_000417 [Mauremys mutica]
MLNKYTFRDPPDGPGPATGVTGHAALNAGGREGRSGREQLRTIGASGVHQKARAKPCGFGPASPAVTAPGEYAATPFANQPTSGPAACARPWAPRSRPGPVPATCSFASEKPGEGGIGARDPVGLRTQPQSS